MYFERLSNLEEQQFFQIIKIFLVINIFRNTEK